MALELARCGIPLDELYVPRPVDDLEAAAERIITDVYHLLKDDSVGDDGLVDVSKVSTLSTGDA